MTGTLAPGGKVVVIGAGPAGLTAGLELQRRGADVTVLEATDAIGGLSQTVEHNGYRFDIGGHRFFTKIPRVQAFWHDILGDQFIRVPRLSRIHYRGKFFDYPLRAANALAGLGPMESVRILASYVRARLKPIRPEVSFEDWVVNRFGRRLFEIFFKTYTEKVWGLRCSEIQAEWAAQRIQNLSLWAAVRNALPIQRRGGAIRSLIHEFDYPRLGPGQMWERCAERLRMDGGEVVLDASVSHLVVVNGGVTGVVAETPGGTRFWGADHVVSTMPLRQLVHALGAHVQPETRDAAQQLRYRDFITVALVLDRADVFPDNWIYVHTEGVKVGRIQNFNNWSMSMIADPQTTCLGLEYFCFEGDSLWTATDKDLIALAEAELSRIGIAVGVEVLDSAVVRMPKAYPIYDEFYADAVRQIQVALGTFPNVLTVGRNGMHKYNNQDHSMLTAMLAVENLCGAEHDLWAINTDYEYHEEQRLRRGC